MVNRLTNGRPQKPKYILVQIMRIHGQKHNTKWKYYAHKHTMKFGKNLTETMPAGEHATLVDTAGVFMIHQVIVGQCAT